MGLLPLRNPPSRKTIMVRRAVKKSAGAAYRKGFLFHKGETGLESIEFSIKINQNKPREG